MFANFILFCIQKDQFQTWCQTNAQNNLNLAFFNQNQLPLSDQISSTTPTWAYNCSKLFTVEAKFSFGCIVCMVIVYVSFGEEMGLYTAAWLLTVEIGLLGFIYYQSIKKFYLYKTRDPSPSSTKYAASAYGS